MKPMKSRETFETMKPMKPRNLRNHETTKPTKPRKNNRSAWLVFVWLVILLPGISSSQRKTDILTPTKSDHSFSRLTARSHQEARSAGAICEYNTGRISKYTSYYASLLLAVERHHANFDPKFGRQTLVLETYLVSRSINLVTRVLSISRKYPGYGWSPVC